jgi:hypothetical protein
MKILKEFIVLFICQILVSFVIYEIVLAIYRMFFEPIRNNLSWGITLQIASYFFISIAAIVSLLLALVNNAKKMIWIVACGYLLFALLFLNNYYYTPYRTLLLLFSVLFGMIVAYFTKRKIFLGNGQ